MVKLYVRYIENGTITNINKVGKTWRAEVVKIINADGFIVEEDGTIRHIDE